MPRKKILGPATSRQVLEYFNQADFAAVEVVYDLVGAVMEARRAEEAPAKPAATKAKREKKVAPATEPTGLSTAAKV